MSDNETNMESTLVSDETKLPPEESDSSEVEAQEMQPPEIDAEVTTEQIIEAILFAADSPLAIPKIVSLLGIGSARDVKNHIEALNTRYENERSEERRVGKER